MQELCGFPDSAHFRPIAHWHSHAHAYMRGIFLFSIFLVYIGVSLCVCYGRMGGNGRNAQT